MDRPASAAVHKPTKRLRRSCVKELFDAFSLVFEVVVISLFLLSYHSGFSATVEVAGEILRRILCLLSKPLPVFFIGSVIILAVAVLSGNDSGGLQAGDGKKGRSGGVADNVYKEYVARLRVTSAGGNALEVSLGPEDGKQIVLYSAPGASIDRGKGSRTTTAGTDGRAKNGPPRRRGRLALLGAVREHALEPPATKADASSKAGKHVMMKSPSNSSINRENDSSIIPITVCNNGAKKGPPLRMKETEKYADVASPHGRRRLVTVRDGGSKTVEDMSNEEFNQSVEKYIAKTRRFLQEESMLKINFDALSQSAGYQWIEQRRSFLQEEKRRQPLMQLQGCAFERGGE